MGRQHQDACEKLGIIKGLELKVGLGELAFVGGPHGFSFQTPNFSSFLGSLEGYRLKVAGFEDFKRTSPNFDKDVAETQTRVKGTLVQTQIKEEGFYFFDVGDGDSGN